MKNLRYCVCRNFIPAVFYSPVLLQLDEC